jgi:hypothetical protein
MGRTAWRDVFALDKVERSEDRRHGEGFKLRFDLELLGRAAPRRQTKHNDREESEKTKCFHGFSEF